MGHERRGEPGAEGLKVRPYDPKGVLKSHGVVLGGDVDTSAFTKQDAAIAGKFFDLGISPSSKFGEFIQLVVCEHSYVSYVSSFMQANLPSEYIGIRDVSTDVRDAILQRREILNDIRGVRKMIGQDIFGEDAEAFATLVKDIIVVSDRSLDPLKTAREGLRLFSEVRAYPKKAAQDILVEETEEKIRKAETEAALAGAWAERKLLDNLPNLTYDPKGKEYIIQGTLDDEYVVIQNRKVWVDDDNEVGHIVYNLTISIGREPKREGTESPYNKYEPLLKKRHEIEQQIAAKIGVPLAIPESELVGMDEETATKEAQRILVVRAITKARNAGKKKRKFSWEDRVEAAENAAQAERKLLDNRTPGDDESSMRSLLLKERDELAQKIRRIWERG